MSHSASDPASDQEMLPDAYDKLLPAEKLVHGEHNPRRVRPSETLKQSIAGFGINRPLIVRPDSNEDVFHITDGWQRYQAATSCGWERLPVRIYDDTLDALTATEMESIVREWSTYEWAQYCHSLAKIVETDTNSKTELSREVATRTNRDPNTIRRYIDVLSLPEEVHILLADGPEGSDKQWDSLKNFNPDVRQYSDLQWRVADRLARNQSGLSDNRIIEIAAIAVEFETAEQAIEFVDMAVSNPDTRVDVIRRKVLLGGDYNKYIVIPRVPVELTSDKKQALLDHCREQRQPLSEIVREQFKSLAENVCENEGDAFVTQFENNEMNQNHSESEGR